MTESAPIIEEEQSFFALSKRGEERMAGENQKTRWLETLDSKDVPLVGGKNAFLGELIQSLKGEGIRVPDGFATTSQAYREFLEANQLTEKIRELIKDWEEQKKSLEKAGRAIRALFLK
jgi:pyruvate,water dikinase